MLNLIAADAEQRLATDDFAELWQTLGQATWLNDAQRERYRQQWSAGLTGALNFYRASPLRPPTAAQNDVQRLVLPAELTTVLVPTTVLWGEQDHALLPCLLDGLQDHVPTLQVLRVPEASHWLVHEHPALVAQTVRRLLSEIAATG